MNRNEAVRLIAELDEECKEIAGRSFMLIRPDLNNKLASGYQVKLRARLDEERLRCIEALVDQYGYSLLNEPKNGSLLIYESHDKKSFRSTDSSNISASM